MDRRGKKNIAVLFGAAIGRIRTTGKYRQYNLLTCAVANGVKVAAEPSKYLDQVEKLESRLDDLREKSSRLRGALKYGPSFDTKYMKKKLKSVVSVSDNTVTLEMPSEVVRMGKYVDLPYYSSLVGWKSSNESVATVSSKGVVTIKKAGAFTLTVKTSVSGKRRRKSLRSSKRKKIQMIQKKVRIKAMNSRRILIHLQVIMSRSVMLTKKKMMIVKKKRLTMITLMMITLTAMMLMVMIGIEVKSCL